MTSVIVPRRLFQALGWVEETEDGSRKDRSSSLIRVSRRKSKEKILFQTGKGGRLTSLKKKGN